jgi:thiol-disulfide isomerase/thioredoxin
MHPRPRLIVLPLLLLSSVVSARDLFAPAGPANVLFFIASDCPISNGYAPEIQRICSDYRKKGVSCSLVYEDVSIDDAHVRAHRDAYQYKDIAAVIDGDRTIAERVKATVTPQAVVVGPGGIVKYRGRVDNQYAALGKPRRVVTAHDLRDALDAVLAGRVVAHPETEAFGCFIARR